MTPKPERAEDYVYLRRTGAKAELCLDDRHDIVVSIPSRHTGVSRIVGYLSFDEWKAAGSGDARTHLVVTMVRRYVAENGEEA